LEHAHSPIADLTRGQDETSLAESAVVVSPQVGVAAVVIGTDVIEDRSVASDEGVHHNRHHVDLGDRKQFDATLRPRSGLDREGRTSSICAELKTPSLIQVTVPSPTSKGVVPTVIGWRSGRGVAAPEAGDGFQGRG